MDGGRREEVGCEVGGVRREVGGCEVGGVGCSWGGRLKSREPSGRPCDRVMRVRWGKARAEGRGRP